MSLVFIIVCGLMIGSFVAAYSWRIVHGISIASGRSFCDKCKAPITWRDNIPVLSYLLLWGKCRNCHKKISPRYPLIELITALSFGAAYLFSPLLTNNISFIPSLGIVGVVFLLFVTAVLIAISVVDIEEMIIPDTFVFVLLGVSFFAAIFSTDSLIWQRLLSACGSALFFLVLHLGTRGRGMGLGDVKLALPLGFLLGFPLSVVWIFSSFIIGAVIGVILLALKKAERQTKIPFGPFMIIGFFVASLVGDSLLQYFVLFK